jgi:type IV pilus assembly protein PilW
MKARIPLHTPRARQAAFSLVELMVAMTLSLILVAGALSIIYSTRLTTAENERVARIQEAGRTAFELIMQDARATGYVGCTHQHTDNSTIPPVSNVNTGLNSTTLLWNFKQPVYGFEAGAAAWTPALDAAIPATSPTPTAGNDILVLRTARPGAPTFRTRAAIPSPILTGDSPIPVDRDPSLSLTPGTPAIISDCNNAAIFVVTGFAGAGATASISHAQGGAPVGNVDAFLNPKAHSFAAGSLVQPIQTVIYYIASCQAPLDGVVCTAVTPPALWEIVGGSAPQELIQGVEAMQLRYGVNSTNNANLLADQYLTASDIDGLSLWGSVVSVNLAVLVRSIDEYGQDKDTRTYQLLGGGAQGGTYGPFNDRRSRSVFTTTITFRNDTT